MTADRRDSCKRRRDAVRKIAEHREALESLAASDLPVAWVAQRLLNAERESRRECDCSKDQGQEGNRREP